MDLQPPKKQKHSQKQSNSNRRKNNKKNPWPHVCSAKSKRQIIIVYDFDFEFEFSFCFFYFLALQFFVVLFFCVLCFGTSSAKTVREHDQWSQTQETTPTQETQRKNHRKKKPKAKKSDQAQPTGIDFSELHCEKYFGRCDDNCKWVFNYYIEINIDSRKWNSCQIRVKSFRKANYIQIF